MAAVNQTSYPGDVTRTVQWTNQLLNPYGTAPAADQTMRNYAGNLARLFCLTDATPDHIKGDHVAALLDQINSARIAKGHGPIGTSYRRQILCAVRSYCAFYGIPDPTGGIEP